MKTLQKSILAIGAATLLLLLWKMDASEVWGYIRQVGWGFAFIFCQEVVAHGFNALGWRYSYRESQARAFGIFKLFELRIVGDGINYLTPSATIAGEFARSALLGGEHPTHARVAGVVIAKCNQGLAQLLFVLFGLALFARGRVPWLAPYEQLLRVLAFLVLGGLAALALSELAAWRRPRSIRGRPLPQSKVAAMARELRVYFADHPLRCVFSVIFFMLGFAWGAFEGYWICRFLGVPISAGAAFALEALSVAVDMVFFMVPAKVGTQEGGKTAIFALLGLSPRAGFAFGVVRHLRELAWASLGLALYFARIKRSRAGSHPGPEPEAVRP